MSKANNRKTRREELELRIVKLEAEVERLSKLIQSVGRMAGKAYAKDIRY